MICLADKLTKILLKLEVPAMAKELLLAWRCVVRKNQRASLPGEAKPSWRDREGSATDNISI